MKKLYVIFLVLLIFGCGENSKHDTIYRGLISELSQNQQIRIQKAFLTLFLFHRDLIENGTHGVG